MPVEIKQVKAFDQGLVERLFAQIGTERIVPNRSFFDDDRNILLVAYCDALPCAFLYAYFLDDLRTGRGKIFLYSIDVFNAHRRKGVGTQLLGALKRLAEHYACDEIFVITNKNNIAAVRLYEKTGGLAEHDDDIVFVFQ